MIRVNINLSNEPFRKDRHWIAASVALSLALIATLGILVSFAVAGRGEAAAERIEMDRESKLMSALTAEQSRLETVLRQQENGEVIERSVFLNQLLRRKSISWTKIFADLEEVMPHNVRLIQVRPQVNAQNEVYLEMVVGSQSPEPVIDMLMRLEGSPEFGATHMANWLPPSQSEPLYRYRINVNYAQKL
ncbi:MAG: hypothetical protein HYZ37_11795 [Candidatus Solibacter usitatus]|nr:hypothetical protein [Candidatus Solibacter usitatus]